ncbi:hypothetical protein [Rhodocyclus tenuis]|uniref:Phage head morphogenesis domain-containing protein n=1 Tax=Rhodocyclus tenuis TaxID=1066 RepID=A0A840GA79_RHOTE|nr:hypothetical protein [Rhodocyclus tenuis]MBB4248381.1 hypothetical protein [Rhodocyclus tenuis]
MSSADKAAGKAVHDVLELRTRLINDTAGEIRTLLQTASVEIAKVLQSQPGDYARWYLPALQAEIDRVLRVTAATAAGAVESGLSESISAGRDMIDRPIAAGLPNLAAALPIISVPQLEAMRAFATSKISGITIAAADAINTQLGLVMIGGQSPYEAVVAITDLLQEETTQRGVMIVRTQLAQAYSTAGQSRMDQTLEYVPDLQKRWLASRKANPRQNHQLIAHQLRPAGMPFDVPTKNGTIKMMCPHDPTAPAGEIINCGCCAVPVVPGWESRLPKYAD